MNVFDTLIIGGGQAGLSVGYFLHRKPVNFLILDQQTKPGGGWLKTWDNLTLFSPTAYSSLSGWPMPKSKNEYPDKEEFIDYLEAYESRYDFPIKRNTRVEKVTKENDVFKLKTSSGVYKTKTLVSATGTAGNPYIPHYPNQLVFKGKQIHSIDYKNAVRLEGKKVLVIGGGNSGAQILAEVSRIAKTKWVTLTKPNFLPEEIDGRYLFHQANARYFKNKPYAPKATLNDVIQVKTVKEALQRNVYKDYRPFTSFYQDGVVWQNGTHEPFDVVIWCTGFRASLRHLRPLPVFNKNRIKTKHTRSVLEPALWLVGYGNWTGYASATIYGVGKTARHTAQKIEGFLKSD